MVSSKCCQVVSPSPLRFFAALIPPWAQTECDRFTGTIENRSTCPPASAILMTAARPARPPPTTMILGVTAIISGAPRRSMAAVTLDLHLFRWLWLYRGREGIALRNHCATAD